MTIESSEGYWVVKGYNTAIILFVYTVSKIEGLYTSAGEIVEVQEL